MKYCCLFLSASFSQPNCPCNFSGCCRPPAGVTSVYEESIDAAGVVEVGVQGCREGVTDVIYLPQVEGRVGLEVRFL